MGFDILGFLGICFRNVFTKMCTIASKSFYLETGEGVYGIARDYQVDFVVMDKDQASKFGSIPAWEVSFENKLYTVLVPPK